MGWMGSGRRFWWRLSGELVPAVKVLIDIELCFVLLTFVCSHEGNASLLDRQEEGWCQRIPTLVPELERTANWPI
jgi:hypothetical protein